MKKNTKILLFVFAFLFAGLLNGVSSTTAAPFDYVLMEKIPGTSGISGSDLPAYISAIYKVALIVVTLSAVLMLSIGGFMYLTSAGNTSSISTAKGIIYDSLIGLVIALSAWLILYTINPDLVEITLTPLPAAEIVNTPRPALADPNAAPTGSDEELAERILVDPNITLLPGGDCSTSSAQVSPRSSIQDIADGERADICTPGCGAVAVGCMTGGTKISNSMMVAMLTVAQTISYTVTSITGGPHASKSSHYQGRAIDIDTSNAANKAKSQALMDAFVQAGAASPNGNAASMCESPQGKNVGCGPATTADHLHLVFSN